ncbi:AurF N-oxygenase family protein [Paraburkholderia susongensis]|uniref:p-aminobenzoate N-oxygenase AurF n=1 Tax=Paraburkholderia susongensis TaxID=1515439 RepID=A0A1X7LL99_9BURK|nr:diiron oxygenase [Paraburkholderia susongensis]SMG54430.1 P-aminobenzoate N-oxygenase AurF [Paraburkholderia susongensis]
MLTDDIVESSHVKETLKKLSLLWRDRAVVNNGPKDYTSIAFDSAKPDFAESLLPFRSHPRWLSAAPELKSTVLSYAWAIYNLKTVYIECDIVTPACEALIKSPVGGGHARYELQQVMSEALLDEALHTKMSISACNYIYQHRKLKPVDYTDFNLVTWRARLLAQCDSEWKRRLTTFAIACASETLITDYLKTLSDDAAIQPLCREVTRAHAIDEWGHSSVFSVAAEHIVGSLSESERAYFANVVPKTVEMFADNEMGAWSTVLTYLDFPHCKEIVEDSEKIGHVKVYQDSVATLLSKLGLPARVN